jgi:hypothetical protein
MRFEAKLHYQLGIGTLRSARIDTKKYSRWWANEEKIHPIEISCPYIFSEETVNIDSPDLAVHANSKVIQKFSSVVSL